MRDVSEGGEARVWLGGSLLIFTVRAVCCKVTDVGTVGTYSTRARIALVLGVRTTATEETIVEAALEAEPGLIVSDTAVTGEFLNQVERKDIRR